MPDAVATYWRKQSTALKSQVGAAREAQGDSSARGSANEDLVADLLNDVLRPRRTVTRSSVLDSSGHRSSEQDVVVCNEDQLLLGDGGRPKLLIVEGVDLVVQVKASLTTREVARIRDSCMSVKQCHKLRSADDIRGPEDDDRPGHFLDHVPYFVLCFGTKLSAPTALARVQASVDQVHPDYRPDGVFVLDRFSILRTEPEVGEGGEDERSYFLEDTAELTLARFMLEALTLPPRIRRRRHPLAAYWRSHVHE
jgi:hypothetical protein